jgi:hypothetical protein
MIKQELIKRSPIRILEQTIHGGLGPGNLGVFVSKKGVGKTACLVHFATDHLLRGERALHISFSDDPQHIASWYQQVYEEVANVYKLEEATTIFEELLRNRLILHFKNQDAGIASVEKNLKVYVHEGGFAAEIIIVDGFCFTDAHLHDLKKWQEIAIAYNAQIWFSATLPNAKTTVADFIQPFANLFSVVIELNALADHIELKLVKDHDATSLEKLRLRLDPKSLLISNRRV